MKKLSIITLILISVLFSQVGLAQTTISSADQSRIDAIMLQIANLQRQIAEVLNSSSAVSCGSAQGTFQTSQPANSTLCKNSTPANLKFNSNSKAWEWNCQYNSGSAELSCFAPGANQTINVLPVPQVSKISETFSLTGSGDAANLTAKFEVAVSALNGPIYLSKNQDLFLVRLVNLARRQVADTCRLTITPAVAVGSSFSPVVTNDLQIIPAKQTIRYQVTYNCPIAHLFAGNYVAEIFGLRYGLGPKENPNLIFEINNLRSSKALYVVGEKAPWIEKVESQGGNELVIIGERLDLIKNLYIDGRQVAFSIIPGKNTAKQTRLNLINSNISTGYRVLYVGSIHGSSNKKSYYHQAGSLSNRNIVIDSPNGGIWYYTKNYRSHMNINWQAFGMSSNDRVTLFVCNNHDSCFLIADNPNIIATQGKYLWYLDPSHPYFSKNSGSSRILIQTSSGEKFYSQPFVVKKQDVELEIVNPSRESYSVGNKLNIVWKNFVPAEGHYLISLNICREDNSYCWDIVNPKSNKPITLRQGRYDWYLNPTGSFFPTSGKFFIRMDVYKDSSGTLAYTGINSQVFELKPKDEVADAYPMVIPVSSELITVRDNGIDKVQATVKFKVKAVGGDIYIDRNSMPRLHFFVNETESRTEKLPDGCNKADADSTNPSWFKISQNTESPMAITAVCPTGVMFSGSYYSKLAHDIHWNVTGQGSQKNTLDVSKIYTSNLVIVGEKTPYLTSALYRPMDNTISLLGFRLEGVKNVIIGNKNYSLSRQQLIQLGNGYLLFRILETQPAPGNYSLFVNEGTSTNTNSNKVNFIFNPASSADGASTIVPLSNLAKIIDLLKTLFVR